MQTNEILAPDLNQFPREFKKGEKMTLHLKLPSQNNNLSPRILVIGIGGTGGNIINSMISSGIEGVDFLNVNTDSQPVSYTHLTLPTKA